VRGKSEPRRLNEEQENDIKLAPHAATQKKSQSLGGGVRAGSLSSSGFWGGENAEGQLRKTETWTESKTALGPPSRRIAHRWIGAGLEIDVK